MRAALKHRLKQIPAAVRINAKLKCWGMKRDYEALCRKYGSPSILSQPEAIRKVAVELWAKRTVTTESTRHPSVLFVGTDAQQDYSGLIQALESVARVTVLEHAPGHYGQMWPKSEAPFDEAREHNATVLRSYLDRLRSDGGVDIIVGQMWGLSMYWRALAEAREAGVEVINIAMDDRHSFHSRRLSDGTWSGTAGIAPFVSVSCTAAPECVAWYEAEGYAAMFLPEASDPSIYRPGEDKSVDVSFVGARYGVREKLVTALARSGVHVDAFGSGWPNGRINSGLVPSLFARSRIILGCGTIGHCDNFVALKLRDFDAAASGSMYVTHYNPDLEPLYEVGREMVTFQRATDLVDTVRHYLRSDAEREAIGLAGRERSVRDHTWRERVNAMMRTVL